MVVLTAADEGPHQPGGPRWSEQWGFCFVSDMVGGYVRYVRRPRRVWYQAALVGEASGTLSVVDDAVPVPRDERHREIRAPGLWAHHVCEEPGDHWSCANEALAVRLDDPTDGLGEARGQPTAVAFDLEWEAAAAASPDPDGYTVPAQVHGDVQVASMTIELAAAGFWWHQWGDGLWDEPRAWVLVDGRRQELIGLPEPLAAVGQSVIEPRNGLESRFMVGMVRVGAEIGWAEWTVQRPDNPE